MPTRCGAGRATPRARPSTRSRSARRTRAPRRLAEAENQADAIAGLDLSSQEKDVAGILIDLARRETKTFSLQFAQGVVGQLKNAARLHQHPLKSAAFVVLKAPDVPSILVELGYVTNKADLKSLISAEWRDRTADSIVQAVDTFFTTRLAGAPPKLKGMWLNSLSFNIKQSDLAYELTGAGVGVRGNLPRSDVWLTALSFRET